jgi:hypothetical protein
MAKLYAQPYDMDAKGFYFSGADEYHKKAAKNRNHFGQVVEEYMFEFIDGTDAEFMIFEALKGGDWLDLEKYEEVVDELADDPEKALGVKTLLKSGFAEKKVLDNLDEIHVSQQSPEDYTYELLEDAGYPSGSDWYFDYERYGAAVRDDEEQNALEQINEALEDEDEEYAQVLQERLNEMQSLSDKKLGMELIDDMYGDDIPKSLMKEYFEYDNYARDHFANAGSELHHIRHKGDDYIIEALMNPKRKRKSNKRKRRANSRRN